MSIQLMPSNSSLLYYQAYSVLKGSVKQNIGMFDQDTTHLFVQCGGESNGKVRANHLTLLPSIKTVKAGQVTNAKVFEKVLPFVRNGGR